MYTLRSYLRESRHNLRDDRNWKSEQVNYHPFAIFTTNTRYIKGQGNTPADALPRNVSAVDSFLINYAANAVDQANDSEVQQLKDNPAFQLTIKVPRTDVDLYVDVSTDTIRPYLPQKYQPAFFKQLHVISHTGCQSSKVIRQTVSPSMPFIPITSCFDHVHVDLVGLLPYSSGHRYILTSIDRFTRWPEAIHLADIHADTVSRALIAGRVSRFRVPTNLTSDRKVDLSRNFGSNL
ncbi:uncharacterized protein LOC134772235 [Penaeus indicus]|uniref:uncharacterized protein LOC134772235 n=1 Tax=Penaeus indicus TaxID=29960 RepID=UPI00300C82CA